MAELRFTCDWSSSGTDDSILRETTANFSLWAGNTCLTRNENVWSRTVCDSVLVSMYPLAMWLASSWWRLNFEPLPGQNTRPTIDWLMAHELGAANHGFVWPRILFASDGESVNIWAEAINSQSQSVRYLENLGTPIGIPLEIFQQRVQGFVNAVLQRLRDCGRTVSDLEALWGIVLEDQADSCIADLRRLEAKLGYDPEECPESVLDKAVSVQSQIGEAAMSELAPVFGKNNQNVTLNEIDQLKEIKGIVGSPQVRFSDISIKRDATPWRYGVDVARKLRSHIAQSDSPISNFVLSELLGFTENKMSEWSPPEKLRSAVAIPNSDRGFDYILRKRHPIAKRFELTRLLGDSLYDSYDAPHWLASTDLSTVRQKYQRAFAAEFLCPIDALVDYLNDDFSESNFEDAANHFGVSEQTVESLLHNNHYLENAYSTSYFPYRISTV